MLSPSPSMATKRFMIVASLASSLVNFRGDLIRALCTSGLEVHAAAPGLVDDDSTYRALDGWGVRCHDIKMRRTGMNPLDDLACLMDLYRLIRRIRPDHLLGYTAKPVIYGTLAGWLARVPGRYALITGLGYGFTGEAKGRRSLVRQLLQHLYRTSLSHNQRVFFQNPDDEALFRDLGLLTHRVDSQVLNGSGVDTHHFDTVAHPETTVFLLIARLLGDKGVREYAEAARRIKSRHPDARFLLVGWIDDNPDAIGQQELDEWVATGTLEYLGRLNDVRSAIAACSVFVLPSYREGTPRTVLEAMAMGRAIITTDAPWCRETVIQKVNGYLVKVKDVDTLEAAMQRFIDDPLLSMVMGQQSRNIAVDRYDVHKVNVALLEGMGIVQAEPPQNEAALHPARQLRSTGLDPHCRQTFWKADTIRSKL